MPMPLSDFDETLRQELLMLDGSSGSGLLGADCGVIWRAVAATSRLGTIRRTVARGELLIKQKVALPIADCRGCACKCPGVLCGAGWLADGAGKAT